MKKISQGKFEICTTKADAIDKFIQMQGICREEISGANPIEFYCSKKGKITITNPPTKFAENTNSTNLYAEIVEQDGKTYITYHTEFSKSNNILKLVILVYRIIIVICAIILASISDDKTISLIVLGLCLAFYAYQLFTDTKEKKNSSKDSEILIQQLQKRVEAVNLWDK